MIERLFCIKPSGDALWDPTSFEALFQVLQGKGYEALLEVAWAQCPNEAIDWTSEALKCCDTVCGLLLVVDPVNLKECLQDEAAQDYLANARQAVINLHIGVVADYFMALANREQDTQRDWDDFKTNSLLPTMGIVIFNQRGADEDFTRRLHQEFGLPIPLNSLEELACSYGRAYDAPSPRPQVRLVWTEDSEDKQRPAALDAPVAVFARPNDLVTRPAQYNAVVRTILKPLARFRAPTPGDTADDDTALFVFVIGDGAPSEEDNGGFDPHVAKNLSTELDEALPVLVAYRDDGEDTERRNRIVSALRAASQAKLDIWDLVDPATAPEFGETDRYLVVLKAEQGQADDGDIEQYVNLGVAP